eukprot:TRINITY_DN6022_c0_g1_i1.p1 TRINITY_DN6022_c0_g1~~TRINITY_DN6022_c0_g1_i1.p1  ORF type:complete len:1331 (+),score=417.41 TRINITY_DN6022_c0_g1_i1:441-3995(+)
MEECFFIYGFSPIGQGKDRGLVCFVRETTREVLAQRRLETLKEFSGHTTFQSEKEACERCIAILSNSRDASFALIYTIVAGRLVLQSYSGIQKGHPIAPSILNLGDSMWPLNAILHDASKKPHIIRVDDRYGALPGGHWPESTHTITITPISVERDAISGIIIVGMSPRRNIDDDYLTFLQLVGMNTSTNLQLAHRFQVEKKKAEALAEINAAKTMFFRNISHEFRTPLTLIMGVLDEAMQDKEHPHRERMELIEKNSMRLLKLVNTLLDFTKIEEGKLEGYEFEEVDLTQITADLCGIFRDGIETSGLKLIFNLKNLDSKVLINRDMWEKIVFNLMSNAWKYTPKGQIFISLNQEMDMAVLKVSDTGIGIPENEISNIFERFHRVEGNQIRNFEGSGIGLALIQQLIKLHDGEISVESRVNFGTTFTVKIPLVKIGSPNVKNVIGRSPLSTPPNSIPSSPCLDRHFPEISMKISKNDVILLVDDNKEMRDYTYKLLSGRWTVRTACDGIEALNILETSFAMKSLPSIVLSDINMPRMGGFEMVQKIRGDFRFSKLPIILLSNQGGEKDFMHAFKAGADDFILKPFSGKELVARVYNHIESGSLRFKLMNQVEKRTSDLVKVNQKLELEMEEKITALEALEENESRYSVLSKLSPVGIFALNNDGRMTWHNDRYTEITHQNPENSDWMLGISPQHILQVENSWNSAFKLKKILVEEFEYVIGSEKVWVLAQILPNRNSHGKIQGFVGTITELSQRKKLEMEKCQALVMAEFEQRQRLADAMAHQASLESTIDFICHELRNPLNGIFTNIDLLRDGISEWKKSLESICDPRMSEEMAQMIRYDEEGLEAIADCAMHQKVISDDVLSLSKLEAHKVILEHSHFSPKQVVVKATEIIKTRIDMQDVQIMIQLPLTDICLMGDVSRITQILTILLTNAIKSNLDWENSKKEGVVRKNEIKISLEFRKETENCFLVSFSVKDNGEGIPEEKVSDIFEFFNKTYQEYGKSGLDLIICKKLAELMSGSMSVKTKLGKGSTFRLQIRCPPSLEEDICSPTIQPRSILALRGSSVLIVDDNAMNRKALEVQLQKIGIHSHSATNGFEAIRIFEQHHFDLILMDVNMPVMSGIEATDIIRKKSTVPIIGLSGTSGDIEVHHAKKMGMTDYLIKPYTRESLHHMLQLYCKPDKTR